jgi:hypothetical protein
MQDECACEQVDYEEDFMMLRYRIWMTLLVALLCSCVVWAGGNANRQSNGALSDVGGTDCIVDQVISSFPATINSTLSGNDCGLRAFADRTYEVQIAQPGSYSFLVSSATNLVDTYMAIMTGCCAGDVIVWDDDGAGIPNGPSALYCVTLAPGTYYVVIEAKNAQGSGAAFTLNASVCPDPCDVSFLTPGDFPFGDNGWRRYVENTDAGTPSRYDGPFTNPYPCQGGVHDYGFDHVSWYDEDFGWRHTFNPINTDTSAHPCVLGAALQICAWDVDINGCISPNADLSLCERDRVYINNVFLPGSLYYLTGSNYANSVWGVTLPQDFWHDNVFNIFVDIDEGSPTCDWATNIRRSQLVVLYRWNHRPFAPTATASSCVTANSPMCVTITGPTLADPDGDQVQCSFQWYRRDGETWTLTDETGTCATPGTYHTGEIWKVEVRCTDVCGLVSEPYTHEFTIVPSCNDNPIVGWDYGNLGGCYPTGTETTGGPANPIHQQNIAWLGGLVTAELTPNIPLDPGDDGVEFLNSSPRRWHPCETEGVVITLTTGGGYTNQPLYLYAWKDGDTNCHFGDVLCNGQAPECFIHARQEIMTGNIKHDTIYFTDPGVPSPRPYKGVFRFRLLSASMSCDSAITYIDPLLGETEDYVFADMQLSVQLLTFAATSEGRAISLSWSTASEQSSDHFLLERRSGSGWQTMAQIRAAGSSSTQRNYRYRDETVDIGSIYEYRLVAVDYSEEQQVLATTQIAASEQSGQTVDDYRLYANYPNPFNPTTTISFDLKESGFVRLRIFDVTGRQVAELVNSSLNAGHYREVFDAKNLPSGLYFYRLETPRFWDMKKMILLK